MDARPKSRGREARSTASRSRGAFSSNRPRWSQHLHRDPGATRPSPGIAKRPRGDDRDRPRGEAFGKLVPGVLRTIKGRSLVLWNVDRLAFEFDPHLLQRTLPRSGRPLDLAAVRSGQGDDHHGVRGVLRGRARLSGRARHVNNADLAVLETHAPGRLREIGWLGRQADVAHRPVDGLRAQFDARLLGGSVAKVFPGVGLGRAVSDADAPRQHGLAYDV